MAINRKPTPVQTSKRKRLMDHQDTIGRGDSSAARTERICISTTKEVADAITEEAYSRHTSRSKLIEEILLKHLAMDNS